MASNLNGSTPAASPVRQKHGPKQSKKKAKQKPNCEAAMGCSPSQAMIVQSTKAESSHLRPTIFMVGEKSFQMLRELGELKFYQLAQHNEAEDSAECLHHDFAAHLENPIQYLRDEHEKITSTSYNTQERSTIHNQTCKIKTDYMIQVHSTKTEFSRDADGLTKREKHVHFKETSSPSRRTSSNDDQTASKNDNRSPTQARTKKPLSAETRHEELTVRIDSNKEWTNIANDPLDEIISVPDTSDTTSTTTCAKMEGTSDIKSKTKMFFGRNRVKPRRDVPDKDDRTKLEENKNGHCGAVTR